MRNDKYENCNVCPMLFSHGWDFVDRETIDEFLTLNATGIPNKFLTSWARPSKSFLPQYAGESIS